MQRISQRLAKLLTSLGLLTQDDDSAYLTLDTLRRQRALRTKNALPQWHYTCDIQSTRFYGPASCASAKAAHQPHALRCKKRGFCPSCGAKRMVEHAALLVDEILPEAQYRQWVLSVPFQLRFLFANKPEVMSKALGIVYRTIATHLIHAAGHSASAVTLHGQQ